MKREIKRDLMCLWIGRLNIGKMSILFQMTFKYEAVTVTITTGFINELDKLILKCILMNEGLRIAQ